jgi:methionine synthase I (cobalamin-dependent)
MPTIHELLRRPPVLFEGAMGTMLMARGLAAGRPGEHFTLEHPAIVADVHRAYLSAGAHVLKTNTFNGNSLRLAACGFGHDAVEACNRRGVAIALEQAGGAALVAGSMGPLGRMLEPHGDVTREQAVDAFAAQAAILIDAGVDLLLVETMYDVREALAALEACRAAGGVDRQRPVIVTLTVSRTPRGYFTMMGDRLEDSLRTLVGAGAFAVGANCTLSSADMVDAARLLVGAVDAPILVQPNAGQPQVVGGATVWPETAQEFAANIARIIDLGVAMVGGCCGTTPAHLAAVSGR